METLVGENYGKSMLLYNSSFTMFVSTNLLETPTPNLFREHQPIGSTNSHF